MRNECNIIRDLLPLYAEEMVSQDTASFVEEHLEGCDACRDELAQMRQPRAAEPEPQIAPLLNLRKKLAAKRRRTIALTAVLVMALMVSAFGVLDAPEFFPYTPELLTVQPAQEGGIRIAFHEQVTDFRYDLYLNEEENVAYCDVEAWTSVWDRWFSSGGERSVTIQPPENCELRVMYVPNDGTENVCVYGQTRLDGGVITLPRLALGYYLILAAGALALAGAVWLCAGKRPRIRLWAERIGLYPAAYVVSHFLVTGISSTSYSIMRDFSLILFLSLLVYCGALLGHSVWRLRREIRQINSGR